MRKTNANEKFMPIDDAADEKPPTTLSSEKRSPVVKKKKLRAIGGRKLTGIKLQRHAAEIGKRIRQVRIARSIPQRLIAEAAAVSEAAVSLWERGQNIAEYERLRSVAKLLDVDFHWLSNGKGNAPDLPVSAMKRALITRVRPIDFDSKSADDPPFPGAIPQAAHGIGVGAEYKKKVAVAWWYLPTTVLGQSNAESVRVFKVETDRLKGRDIFRNDFVLIDTAETGLIDGDLYAVNAGASILLKHIRMDEMKRPKDVGLYDVDPTKAEWLSRAKINFLGRCIGFYRPR